MEENEIEEERKVRYIFRKKCESGAEYKLRKYANLGRYAPEGEIVVGISHRPQSYRTIGIWEPRLEKYVGGSKPQFIDGEWTGKYLIECLWCGNTFESRDPRRYYCPYSTCKTEMFIYRRRLTTPRAGEQRCLTCGGILDKRRGAKFCGNTCTVTFHRQKKKEGQSLAARSHVFSTMRD